MKTRLIHKFVKSVPDSIEEGTLYISTEYATAIHKCCCGCGNEVVTPFSPTDWKLTFDGQTVSLYPSIGNWSFPCKSHYWISHNRVRWAQRLSKAEIEAGRAREVLAKKDYFDETSLIPGDPDTGKEKPESARPEGFWRKYLKWWRS